MKEYISAPSVATVYGKDRAIFMPEVEVKELKPEHTTEALRGYKYIRAVFENDVCIGWYQSP